MQFGPELARYEMCRGDLRPIHAPGRVAKLVPLRVDGFRTLREAVRLVVMWVNPTS